MPAPCRPRRQEIVQRPADDIGAVLRRPEIRSRFPSQGLEATPKTRGEFAKLLAADMDRWAQVVRRAGV